MKYKRVNKLDFLSTALINELIKRLSAGRIGVKVSSSVFVTLVCRQLYGSYRFIRVYTELAFVFVFTPSSSVAVVVSAGSSRGRRLPVRCSSSPQNLQNKTTVASAFCVRYSVDSGTGELLVKRPLLCCDVLP